MAYLSDLTLAEYLSQVKARMYIDRDLDNSLFTDDDITLFLNTAQVEFVRGVGEGATGFFQATDEVDLTTGDISLPSNYLEQLTATVETSDSARYSLIAASEQQMDDEMPSWRNAPAVQWPTHIVSVVGTTGVPKYRFHPQPSATVTDAVLLSYRAKPTVMAADADIAACMTAFPELQPMCLVAGALKELYLFEGGEADDQAQKWNAIFQGCISRARVIYNRLFSGPAYYAPR